MFGWKEYEQKLSPPEQEHEQEYNGHVITTLIQIPDHSIVKHPEIEMEVQN